MLLTRLPVSKIKLEMTLQEQKITALKNETSVIFKFALFPTSEVVELLSLF